MIADSAPYSRKERNTTESEKLMTTADLGITRLIRGAMSAEITSSKPKPGLNALLGRSAMAMATATVPRDTIATLEKLGSFFSLIDRAGGIEI
jgi:hypothetical protein